MKSLSGGGKQRAPRNRSESNSEVKFGNFIWGATGEQARTM